MGGGLKFVILWCAAAVLGILTIEYFPVQIDALDGASLRAAVVTTFFFAIGSAILVPTMHWFLLKRDWGRPYLVLWLTIVIFIPLVLGLVASFLLVGPLLTEMQVAIQNGDAEKLQAIETKMDVWWRQALLTGVGHSGYAVALCYISGRVGGLFLLATMVGAAIWYLVYPTIPQGLMSTDGRIHWDTLAEVAFISLFGSVTIWIGSKPVRNGIAGEA